MNSLLSNTIADPPPSEALQREAARLRAIPAHHILTRGPFELFLFRKEHAPALFFELCRQREITFRLAGQGTGSAFDETPEDAYYDQLVLWDSKHQRLAGAYRLGQTGELLSQNQSPSLLYLTHMFNFEPPFLTRDQNALELTRSFVASNYQNDRLALPLLWQGLGAAVLRLKATRLFGSVTLSSDFSDASRALMVSWLTNHRTHQPKSLAQAHKKFPDHTNPGWNPDRNIDELKSQIVDHNGAPKPIPPLLRHYLTLGASFHAFHIESSFNDAVYCLLEVAVAKIPSAHRERFLKP